jgi:hypothetical protein
VLIFNADVPFDVLLLLLGVPLLLFGLFLILLLLLFEPFAKFELLLLLLLTTGKAVDVVDALTAADAVATLARVAAAETELF